MQRDISRSSLLKGDWAGRRPAALRPPWARPPGAFEQACDGCGRCAPACPQGIIVTGRGGLPRVDFARGFCTLCGDCLRACPTGALSAATQPPWRVVARVDPTCLSLNGVVCRLCGEHCEAEAIRFRLAPGGVAEPEIDEAACTGCGACRAVCPSDAIAMAEAAP